MSTSQEVVKSALSEGIRARQAVLDDHVEVLVQIGKICGQAIENGNKILLCGNGGSAGEVTANPKNEFEDNDCPADGAISSTLSISLALFLDHQERLERMTEQLQ